MFKLDRKMLIKKSVVYYWYDVEIYLYLVIYLVFEFLWQKYMVFYLYDLYIFKIIGFDSLVINML